jgi:CheY-like chemotaxis protein
MNCESTDILLVEDNPNDALLTIRSLKEHNLDNNIIHVSDGQEALDYLYAEGVYHHRNPLKTPKTILLDLKLPKISGLEILARIRADERTKVVPVVILTSSQEESDLKKAYSLGANSYIVKPVDFENFTTVVKQLGLYWLLLNKPPLSGKTL